MALKPRPLAQAPIIGQTVQYVFDHPLQVDAREVIENIGNTGRTIDESHVRFVVRRPSETSVWLLELTDSVDNSRFVNSTQIITENEKAAQSGVCHSEVSSFVGPVA